MSLFFPARCNHSVVNQIWAPPLFRVQTWCWPGDNHIYLTGLLMQWPPIPLILSQGDDSMFVPDQGFVLCMCHDVFYYWSAERNLGRFRQCHQCVQRFIQSFSILYIPPSSCYLQSFDGYYPLCHNCVLTVIFICIFLLITDVFCFCFFFFLFGCTYYFQVFFLETFILLLYQFVYEVLGVYDLWSLVI